MTLGGSAVPAEGDGRPSDDRPVEGPGHHASAIQDGPTTIEAVVEPTAMIFDLDCTLLDNIAFRIEAWQRAFAEAGIIADREHMAMLIGADGERVVRDMATRAGHHIDDDEAERIDRRAAEILDGLDTDPEPRPGAVALLTALTWGGFPWAIVTSGRGRRVDASVDALGLPARPSIVDGSQAARTNPAPDLVLAAAARLGTPAYSTWSVGASSWDMIAARAAGMTGIGMVGIATGKVLLAAGARAVVDDLHGLHEELARRGLVAGEA